MTAAALFLWLLALPPVLDGHGHAIPRPRPAVMVISTVAATTDDPQLFGALLDVIAAKESGYRTKAAGDCPGMRAGSLLCTRERGAKSCGAYQTPCAVTPLDGLGQTRLALATLKRSFVACPVFPLAVYGTGRCQRWGLDRMALVRAALLVPVPADDAEAPDPRDRGGW